MPEALSRLYQQFLELWSNMDKSQKTRTIAIGVISVLCISTAVILLTRPRYELLITGVDSREIGEMSKILEEKKIAHEVTADRTAIKVRSGDKNRAQVTLVQQDYPRSTSMTFADAFGKFGINTTESDKAWVKKEYEERKLADKIKLFDNVSMASVSLNIPEKSLFVGTDRDSQKSTASVVIKPNGEITQKQVQGIVMLIARSVEGLDPKNITVVDTSMNVLNDDSDDSIAGITSKQYELTLIKKRELEKNVKDMFSSKLSHFDGIKPVANVVLDFDTESSTFVTYAYPGGGEAGAVRSSETTQETLENMTPGQAPGMEENPGNVPSYPTGGEQSSSYSLERSTVNYELDQTNTQRVKAVGNLDTARSSMAVSLLYGINVQQEPSKDIIDSLRQTISTATGILPDKISIISLKVTPPEIQQKDVGDILREFIDSYGFFALMVLLIVALVAAMFSKREAGEADLIPQLSTVGSGIDLNAEDIELGDFREISLGEKSEVKKQIEKFVKQKPEAVAQLLRHWLSEDVE